MKKQTNNQKKVGRTVDSVVYAETNQIKKIANEIIELGNDFETIINEMFKKFSDVPYSTKEWVGRQSDKYFDLVALEKDDYVDLANKIRSYGEKLNDDVEDIESTINSVIKKESL